MPPPTTKLATNVAIMPYNFLHIEDVTMGYLHKRPFSDYHKKGLCLTKKK
jgi:hypothetical protein